EDGHAESEREHGQGGAAPPGARRVLHGPTFSRRAALTATRPCDHNRWARHMLAESFRGVRLMLTGALACSIRREEPVSPTLGRTGLRAPRVAALFWIIARDRSSNRARGLVHAPALTRTNEDRSSLAG